MLKLLEVSSCQLHSTGNAHKLKQSNDAMTCMHVRFDQGECKNIPNSINYLQVYAGDPGESATVSRRLHHYGIDKLVSTRNDKKPSE